MNDKKFAIYSEIRDYIEDKILNENFTLEERNEMLKFLNEDIPQIITNE